MLSVRGWQRSAGALCIALALACGNTSAPHGTLPGTPIALSQRPAGTSRGNAASALIDPVVGGTVTSDDGRLTVTFPPGAVSAPTQITVDQITNTAPGGVGDAYRIGPAGTVFAVPVTLTFTPDLTATTVNALTIGWQSGGFWMRYRDVQRDATAGTLTATTSYAADWAVMQANTSNDLRGAFTVVAQPTSGVPYTMTGDATFNYGGEDANGIHYLQWGTLSLQSPVAVGTASCTPAASPLEIATNVADLATSPGGWDWGVSADWSLSCVDGTTGATSTSSLPAAFDTYGINQYACTRSYSGTPIFSLTQVKGTMVVDCGTDGTYTADFDFQSCSSGASCTSSNPCHTAAISCTGAYPACVDTGNAIDGTACPTGVCTAGVCG